MRIDTNNDNQLFNLIRYGAAAIALAPPIFLGHHLLTREPKPVVQEAEVQKIFFNSLNGFAVEELGRSLDRENSPFDIGAIKFEDLASVASGKKPIGTRQEEYLDEFGADFAEYMQQREAAIAEEALFYLALALVASGMTTVLALMLLRLTKPSESIVGG